jgi:hypothetical protein
MKPGVDTVHTEAKAIGRALQPGQSLHFDAARLAQMRVMSEIGPSTPTVVSTIVSLGSGWCGIASTSDDGFSGGDHRSLARR